MNFLLNNEKSTLNEKIKHLKQSGSIKRKSGIGRPRTTANIDAVDELVLSQENAPQTRSIQYDRLREKRVFILLTQHQFVNNINVGGRSRLPIPDFLVIDPVCVKRLIKSFSVLFCHPFAGNSLVSLTALQHLAYYNFLI